MNIARRDAVPAQSIASLIAGFDPALAVHPGADLSLPSAAQIIDYSLTRLRAGKRIDGELREAAAADAARGRILIEAAAFDPVEQLRHELSALAGAANPTLACAVLVRKRKRVAGIRRVMSDYFAAIDERSASHATLLVGTAPGAPPAPAETPPIAFVDPKTKARYWLETAPGLFSGTALDRGTAVLLDSIPLLTQGRAIDVGSGYGPLTVALAGRGFDTTYVDVDARALRMTGRNLAGNGLEGTPLASVDLGELTPASYDLAISNPPTHAGSDVLRQLFSNMVASLNPGGRMMIVVREHLNYEKWLAPLGTLELSLVEAGYKVLTVTRG